MLISFQVLGHKQATIGDTMVDFEIVDIFIHNGSLAYNVYGYKVSNHTIHIRLNDVSEMQFVATLVHELAHVLIAVRKVHRLYRPQGHCD